jgi:hypothetical protein
MDADGMPPVKPAEVGHESGRTRITRLNGGTVIRKEPLGPDAERRVRHERAMLERLRGVAGVAQLAQAPRYPGSVLLTDAGHASLAEAVKPLAADELAPALDEGLLVAEPGAREAVRFRHDRIREAVLASLDPRRRAELQLAMARRLAEVPELFAVAAEQYLPVTGGLHDAGERRRVAGLLHQAAKQAALIGDDRLAERLLTAALALTEPDETASVLGLRTRRHAALFSLGRLDEADEDYAVIDALTGTVLDRPEATPLQVRSLTNRGRTAEANDLGTRSLRECGITVPAADELSAEVDRQLDHMYWWLDHTDAGDDAARPEVTDPRLVTAGRLLNVMLASTFFVDDPAAYGWVSLRALRIWTEHGAARTLVGAAANAAFSAITLRGDYAAAYRVARRVLPLSETRDHAPDVSHARHVLSILQSWFEPIENSVQTSFAAHEELLAGGDLANTSYTYYTTVTGLLDYEPTMDACLAQVDATRSRSSTYISPARSPRPSSAISPAWPGTARRHCRCCRSPSGTPSVPWPIRCAG